MTATAPQLEHARLFDLLDACQIAWRSIIVRCDTGRPFKREEVTQILDTAEQSLEMYLGFIRHWVETSRSPIPMNELMARLELVAVRVQELEQQLCCSGPRSNQPTKHSQPTQL